MSDIMSRMAERIDRHIATHDEVPAKLKMSKDEAIEVAAYISHRHSVFPFMRDKDGNMLSALEVTPSEVLEWLQSGETQLFGLPVEIKKDIAA